ncbi:MAG TPA: 2-phosphosulfolactate phosphatase [Anaerolineales bacterium]|nr:2-phosphosulfolactate phosphatase [Anaerolineales bacterium]
MMKFHYTDLEDCHTAKGVVIVIDVLRAFSTAAYAFSRGAKEILLVSSVEEALLLRSSIPNSRAMGEVGGLPPPGFDFGNSPTHIREMDLSGITLIQRTGAGTQGAVRSQNAEVMLASSFVVAEATVRHISALGIDEVTFVVTGRAPNRGDEDLACAEYLEALLKGSQPDTKPFVRRVFESRDALQHLDPAETGFPLSDLDYCTQIDHFDFAMPITRNDGKLSMRTFKPT